MPNPEHISTLTDPKEFQSDEIDLVDYIDQVEEYFDAVEPDVMAFLPEKRRFDRLRREVTELKKTYPNEEARPPLYGLLVGVKDIFHVDGFDTQAGSNLPIEALRGEQAACVTQLKEAGALILGKTVTTEFAYFAPGPTRNPHNLEHTPGGSSSGSAAATAAGLVPLALGTQTIGSVTRPASFCGVYGYKPSYKRISKAGVIPLASTFDHVGIFSNKIDTIQLAASVLCADWSADSISKAKPKLAIPDEAYLQLASDEMRNHYERIIEILIEAPYEIRYFSSFDDIDEVIETHNLILAYEAAITHESWFKDYEGLYNTKTVELIKKGQSISTEKYSESLNWVGELRKSIREQMDGNEIDLWISPSAVGPAPKGLDSTGNPIMNLPWTQSGLPTINIPSGVNDNSLPLGIQLTANWYQDEQLLVRAKGISEVVG